MKTWYVVTLSALFSTLVFSSCSKKSDDIIPTQTTAPTQAEAGFQVKIDRKVNYTVTNLPGNSDYYTVYGLDSKTGDVVMIALPGTVGEGTLPINTVNVGMQNTAKVAYSTVNGGSGTVTITKKTATNMIGTFSFTAYDASATIKSSFNLAFK